MDAISTRITQGGRLVIPASIRKLMNFADGDLVLLQVVDGALTVRTLDDRIDALQAYCAPLLGEGAVDDFIAERHREAAKELA